MEYRISKLANRIAKDLEVETTKAWDALEELGYEPQDLTEAQVKEWRIKVAARIGWYK